MLTTDTLLSLPKGDHCVRLSYVFEDDHGCRKGLTVRQLLADPFPSNDGEQECNIQRSAVHLENGTLVGFLDPELTDPATFEPGETGSRNLMSSAAMTCIFTISDKVEIDAVFHFEREGEIANLADLTGTSAHIIGVGPIGKIKDEFNYLQLEGRCVYPLMRLDRSDEDKTSPNPGVRNGAMVTTECGDLVGVIVSVFNEGGSYGIVPIRDVLEKHRLRFMQDGMEVTDQQVQQTFKRSSPKWVSRPVNPKFEELVA